MAGHSKLHPYLKSYDELKRTYNRMQDYLIIHSDSIPVKEEQAIKELLESIENAILNIPEKYHVSRYSQFNK